MNAGNDRAGSLLRTVAGTPALTLREVRLGLADKDNGRHWSHGRCWCDTGHGGGKTGLTFTAPPWDESRDTEVVR